MEEEKTMDKVVEASTKFAADLFKEICAVSPDSNVFISPFSLSTILTMTLVGAREQTEVEMAKVLGVDNIDKELLHTSYKDILASLSGTANVANRIFLQHNYEVLSSFMDVLQKNYNSGCTNVSFGQSSATDAINSWVKKETNNKIPKLVDSLTSDVVMVIANAIYFKSLWKNQFKPSNTNKQPFYVNDKNTVQVNMMHQTEHFGLAFHEDTNTDVLELPHQNNKTSMLILLPRDAGDFKKLESQFRSALLDTALSTMLVRKTKVWLPAFKLEESYTLRDALVSLGMSDLFSYRKANLTGISKYNDLYASKVIHKTFIEVNEEGTEAAAVTAVVIKKRCLELVPEFRANHPFLFCILEKNTRNILFLGKLVKPSVIISKSNPTKTFNNFLSLFTSSKS